jgi:zinc/manganese transport system substrate-binding protein
MNKKITGIIVAVVVIITAIVTTCVVLTSNPEKKAEGCGSSLNIVVTVNQWTSIANELAGECTKIDTIVSGTDVDPHEFEPLPADVSKIEKADILIVNGLGYDEWATKAAQNAKGGQKIINIGELTGHEDGDNPHLWYSASAMEDYTNKLKTVLEETSGKSQKLDNNYIHVLEESNLLKLRYNSLSMFTSGRHYVATEGVADYLAADLGLIDSTPDGYKNSVQNEAEPSISDLEAFKSKMTGNWEADRMFMFYNSQEEDDTTKDLRAVAMQAGLTIIDVTEQMPDNYSNLQTWIGETADLLSVGPMTDTDKQVQEEMAQATANGGTYTPQDGQEVGTNNATQDGMPSGPGYDGYKDPNEGLQPGQAGYQEPIPNGADNANKPAESDSN